jgi:precorrin-8X/cobalt-precorrin-8 methylmutase
MRGDVTWRDALNGHDETAARDSAGAEFVALRSRIDLAGLPPLTRMVAEQIIGTSADLGYANDLVSAEPWLEAAVGALAAGAAVVVDGPMVAAGLAAGAAICKVGESLTERLARTAGIAMAAAAIRLAYGDAGPGAVWVVGSEPVAIYEILSRNVQPALVIGMPAGFVAAVEAKKALRASGLPALTNVGEKGGPAVAAAACQALLALAGQAAAMETEQRGAGRGSGARGADLRQRTP